MEYEDRITIATPEGIELAVPLAGLGSRFVAQLIDSALKVAIIIALIFALGAAAGGSDASDGGPTDLVAVAVLVLIIFLITFAFDVLFETLGRGRTPGKRLSGLRVVLAGGEPVGLRASAIRNLLRIIDGEALLYLPGMVSILVTRNNQRLGDLAATTLVVRERTGGRRRPAEPQPVADEPAATEPGATDAWDVSAVTREDLVLVRRFLARRAELDPAARSRLARDVAGRLRPKVAGAPPAGDPEPFLEALARAKASR